MTTNRVTFRQLQRFNASDLDAMLSEGEIVVYVDSQAKFVVSRHKGQESHTDSQAAVMVSHEGNGSKSPANNAIYADSQREPKLISGAVKNGLGTNPSDSQAKKAALQGLIASIEGKGQIDSQPEYIPWYNPARHVVGQKVRMKDGQGRVQTVITPEVDGDGRPMWESW